jgi:hypothetical protein
MCGIWRAYPAGLPGYVAEAREVEGMEQATRSSCSHCGSPHSTRNCSYRVSWLGAHLLGLLLTKCLHRKELGEDPSPTLSLVHKWGPSTRNIIRSIKHAREGSFDPIEQEVYSAVEDVCQAPLDVLQGFGGGYLPRDNGSSFIFVRRPADLERSISFIPTKHLTQIFEGHCLEVANKQCLELFISLSSHALTRTAADWLFEKSVHIHLGVDGGALKIFHDSIHAILQPATNTRVLHGAVDSLKQVGVSDAFYWIPSVVNFPGVDSVLGTSDGRVFTVQTTIAARHDDPIEGIKKVWDPFEIGVREERTWHFVVVTDTEQLATSLVKELSGKIVGFTLEQGRGRSPVQVWGCCTNDSHNSGIVRRLML